MLFFMVGLMAHPEFPDSVTASSHYHALPMVVLRTATCRSVHSEPLLRFLEPTMPMPANVDPADVVKTYQAVVTERDDPDAIPKVRRELDRTAYRLRMLWAKWQGEDSLNKIALGELAQR